ncbi:phage tail tube protein [Ferrimonas sp.]|uniref:phage tail tube protein n=1 Tax=Ferrimonas sp. TaxID=2080861 RepID=UPI003A924019
MANKRLWKDKLVVLKAEASYGVDATPGAGDAVRCAEVGLTPMDGDSLERPFVSGELGHSEQFLVNTHVSLTLKVELAGSGAAATPPKWAGIIAACGRLANVDNTPGSEHVDFELTDQPEASVTVYFYMDKVLHQVTGTRGTYKLTSNAGELPYLEFELKGLFTKPQDDNQVAGNFEGWTTPLKVGSAFTSFTLAGVPLTLLQYSYDVANEYGYSDLVNGEEVEITDRAPTLTLLVRATDLATFDPFDLAENHSRIASELVHGVAGNQIEHRCPELQLERPTYQESDGKTCYQLTLRVMAKDTLTTR